MSGVLVGLGSKTSSSSGTLWKNAFLPMLLIGPLICTEVILSFAISAGVSIIFTILFIKLLKQTLMILNLYYPLSFSIISILVLVFIIGVIMMVIYLVMKRKIKKMNIVEELKYE